MGHGRKRGHILALNEPEMHAEPKDLRESRDPAHLDPPPGQRGPMGTRRKRRQRG